MHTQRSALLRSLLSLLVTLVVMGALLFWPAGTLRWPLGWWFAAAFLTAVLIATFVLWRVNPEIFEARSRVQPGTKAWDYIFITVIIGSFAMILPIAALDFKFGWSSMSALMTTLGYLLFAASFAGQVWAQAVNRHFEPGVRIQKDRGHTVIDTGPYALVRHPGYISASLMAASIAFMLGSFWALLPATVVVVALAIRTRFEEDALRAELPGYSEYMDRVSYRWVPGAW